MLNEESCPSITNFSAGLQKVNQERGNNHSFFAADSQIGRKLIAEQLSFLGGASGTELVTLSGASDQPNHYCFQCRWVAAGLWKKGQDGEDLVIRVRSAFLLPTLPTSSSTSTAISRGTLHAGVERDYAIAGHCGIPSTEYQRLTRGEENAADLLAMPEAADVQFEPPRLMGSLHTRAWPDNRDPERERLSKHGDNGVQSMAKLSANP